MEGTYATVLTSAGAALVAESILTGKKLQITQAAVGDGGGAACRPDPNQTALAGERWRGGVATAQQNSANPNVLDVKIVVGEEVGGFTIREAAIFNEAGVMVALCNTPETEKVTASGGASGKFTMVMHLAVADSSAVEVVVRPTLNTVSGEELEAALEAHEGSAGAHAGRLIPAGAKGAAGGVAELDGSGKVPSQQLPAMNYDAAGSAAAVQASLASHTGSTGNPHSVTKAQVGLPNVDNTSDASKPISTAMQTALNGKLTTPTGATSQVLNGVGAPITPLAAPTNGSVLPFTAGGAYTQLALKANLAGPALTGTPTAPTAAAGTNTTQIATTAFVQAALSGAYTVGTWTPTVQYAESYPVRYGRYIKIGNFVILVFHLQFTATTTVASGTQLRIDGIPYVPNIMTSGHGYSYGSSQLLAGGIPNGLSINAGVAAIFPYALVGGYGGLSPQTYTPSGTHIFSGPIAYTIA